MQHRTDIIVTVVMLCAVLCSLECSFSHLRSTVAVVLCLAGPSPTVYDFWTACVEQVNVLFPS